MKNTCIEVSVYGDKLHRLFLDIIKMELDALSIPDINSIQALTLINIGNNIVTIGELIAKSYYTGSNASYNVKKMVSNGYIIQEPSEHDKRSCYIKLSNKGLCLLKQLLSCLEKYTSVNGACVEKCLDSMKKVNSMWRSLIID
jgi:DNA-binding MarR family transcriptional regulator